MQTSANQFVRIAALAALVFMGASAQAKDENRVKLEGRLNGPTLADGKAKYEQRGDGRRKFSVEVEDTIPGAVHTIVVMRGGVPGASVDAQANALGVVDLNLDTDLGQAVAVLQAGDQIVVWVMGRPIVAGRL